MSDYLVSMGIALVLTGIKESFKNPKSKAQLKSALLKVFRQIKLLYADDPDFGA